MYNKEELKSIIDNIQQDLCSAITREETAELKANLTYFKRELSRASAKTA